MLPLARRALVAGVQGATRRPLAAGIARPLSVSTSDLVVPPGASQAYDRRDALADPKASADSFIGVTREVYAKRTAKIFMPAKTATSSGKNVAAKWRLSFPTPERWTNNLMGWTSTRDPLSNISMDFNSLEQATQYAEAMGCRYEVVKPKSYRVKPKSYSENFVWRGPKLDAATKKSK